jgi:hypothetical protein
MLSRKEVRPPPRQVCCPQYGFCLNLAIDSNSTGFNCRTCERRGLSEPIDPNEGARCGLLIREIFFHAVVLRKQAATCIRCGEHFTMMAGKGASPRKFCPACRTYSNYLGDWTLGAHIETRSAYRLPLAPLGDEPGVGED